VWPLRQAPWLWPTTVSPTAAPIITDAPTTSPTAVSTGTPTVGPTTIAPVNVTVGGQERTHTAPNCTWKNDSLYGPILYNLDFSSLGGDDGNEEEVSDGISGTFVIREADKKAPLIRG